MANRRFSRSAALLVSALLTAAVGWLLPARARGADGPGHEVLKKHGLTIVGSLAVTDEEAAIKSKMGAVRRLSRELKSALVKQSATGSPEDVQKTLKALNTQIGQLKSELNTVNQQMAQFQQSNTRYGGRFGNNFANNYAQEQYNELLFYRNQVQQELNQETYYLNELKTQVSDPRSKERIDTDVRESRDAYHQALLDLRKLFDAANAKYDEARKDDDVKNALTAAGKGLREKPKLGPSHEFLANQKLVERMEKAEASGDNDEGITKPSKRKRSRTRTKGAAKTSAAAAATQNDP